MFLKSVKIYNIRNISQLELSFPAALTILIGQNAQGKTNILESLFLLSHARSFREAHNEHLIKSGEDYGFVEGTLSMQGRDILLRVVIQKGSRIAFLNGKRCSRLSELAAMPSKTVIFSEVYRITSISQALSQ
ncbi:AAA family ATPase [candidate division CSSED10-310 bacterium]|uniref:AAA family ATPase n=1 Tax=candidate division CSSED10-310 bacterium TaxID=2855610 RepID=A0ABV6YWL3_UNCC1